MDLDTGKDDRRSRAVQHLDRLVQRLLQGRGVVAGRGRDHRLGTFSDDSRQRAVAWHLDIHRSLVARGGGQHASYFALRGGRIVQHALRDRHFPKHPHLRAEIAHAVMQQGIAGGLAYARRAADHDHR